VWLVWMSGSFSFAIRASTYPSAYVVFSSARNHGGRTRSQALLKSRTGLPKCTYMKVSPGSSRPSCGLSRPPASRLQDDEGTARSGPKEKDVSSPCRFGPRLGPTLSSLTNLLLPCLLQMPFCASPSLTNKSMRHSYYRLGLNTK